MTPKTRGRPSLYREEFAEQARKLCLLGATDQKLADFFEIEVRTIYDWKRTKPEFSQAIARGKMLADAEVAAKLYERACGYPHGAIKIYRADDGSVIKVPYTVEYPPDTTAASLWLRNRQPRLWRDKHEIDVADAGERWPARPFWVGTTKGPPHQCHGAPHPPPVPETQETVALHSKIATVVWRPQRRTIGST